MRPDLESIQEYIEADLAAFRHRASMRIEQTMRQGVLEWQKKNPNHSVRFLDAMGTHGFIVDGEWLDEMLRNCWPPHSFKRMDDVLAPLFELTNWYCDIADQANICIEFEIPRMS